MPFQTKSQNSVTESNLKLLKLPAEYFKSRLPEPGEQRTFLDDSTGKFVSGIVRKSVVGLSVDANTLHKQKIVKIELEAI